MDDINDSHGGGSAADATFPVAMYVIFISYLALLLVPCLDLMQVLSMMCVVKYACASVMLFSVIKLTRKLSNNLTSIMMSIRLHVKKHASRTWREKARNKDKKKV
jgi:choline-glycine betaine transporter